jgi:hypothetical protein
MAKKSFNPAILLLFWVPILTIGGIAIYMNTEDCYRQYCITGWEAVKLQGSSFWTWVWICTPLGLLAGYFAYKNISGSGKVGEKMQGKDGTSIALIILAFALLMGPWGKGCTDKTNGGVTAEKYSNEKPAP